MGTISIVLYQSGSVWFSGLAAGWCIYSIAFWLGEWRPNKFKRWVDPER